ncbi:MAG: MFS transporter [Candidatus Bathyarchaeia archaeon]
MVGERLRGSVVEASTSARLRGVFFNLGLFQFLTFVRRGVFYTFMINYLYMLMGTVTSTAALGTLNMFASGLGQNLLWGKISDRYKLRARLVIVGETIAAFAYIAVFLAHKSFIDIGDSVAAGLTIIFGLSILEFFWSMSDVGWAALLTDVTTPEIRGKVVGVLNFIASLGRMFGIFFAGYLYFEGEGFRNGTIFFTVTTLLFVGAIIMALVSRREKAQTATSPIVQKHEKIEDEFYGENERTYKWFLASLIIIVLGMALVNQIFLLFLELPEGLGAQSQEMSIILAAWTVGGMIASLTSGSLADKVGREKAIVLGLFLAILTPITYGFARSVPLMAFVYGLNGVAFWTVQTVGFALAGDLIPEHRRGRLFGRYNTVMALSWGPAGLFVGGPFADFQVNVLGTPKNVAYINAFYLSSIIVALGTALFIAKIVFKSKTRNINSKN